MTTPGTITFVANVGEEGLGDLRGVKALFNETLKEQIDRFVSIDNAGFYVGTIGVGSYRYRFTFKGPGGHSFADFGIPSPASALGRAVTKIADLRVPRDPWTTFNVGRIGGGTSVNAIPAESWMEVDIRSSDAEQLAALDRRVLQAVNAGVTEENVRWNRPNAITVVRELVGDRPAGTTPENAPIVLTALAAARSVGAEAPFSQSSSDANLPMSLKIPAISDRRRWSLDELTRAHRVIRLDRKLARNAVALLMTIAARALKAWPQEATPTSEFFEMRKIRCPLMR